MRYRELAKRLRALDCEEIRSGKGSHRTWHNPLNGTVTTIPDWGHKDLALGTVRAISVNWELAVAILVPFSKRRLIFLC